MIKKIWAKITGDSVEEDADRLHTRDALPRYHYSEGLIDEINRGRRYKILSNRAQTEIYIVDHQYNARVAKLYDMSYALIVADKLNDAME
jgi:hypothetical protein